MHAVAIVDLHLDPLAALAAQAGHQVAGTERCADPAGNRGAALRLRDQRHMLAIYWQHHHEAGNLLQISILPQPDLAAHGRQAGIARLFHRGSPRRVGQRVEAKCQPVAAAERFQVDGGRILGPLTGWLDVIVGIAVTAYLRHMGVARRMLDQRNVADTLDAGEMQVQVLPGQIGVEGFAPDRRRTLEQPLRAIQHLLVSLHAHVDAVDQLAHAAVEIGLRLLLGIGPGAEPQRRGQTQASCQHRAGQHTWAEQHLDQPATRGPGQMRCHERSSP